ncbi:unnamed protein product [Urochloa decumbens]|uniref:Glycosyltransferase n=1 Tax=Urochloa decumbens TaxID=240449 RepID=A0ABC8YRN6_9POAL
MERMHAQASDATAPPPHVVVLTSPGAGHVAPVAEFAARLAAHHGVTTTIVTLTNLSSPDNSSALAALPPGVSVATLPEVPLDDLPLDAHIVTRIITAVRRALPHLRDLLRSLLRSPAGVAAFLADMLCPAALAVAEELGVQRHVFYPSSLTSLASLLYTPELARTTAGECSDLPEPVLLPGCAVPMRGADLVEPVQRRADPVYALMVDLGLDYLRADGFIVNTFGDMERDTLAAFGELSDRGVYPPAYAVGPIVRSCSDEAAKHVCMTWLDGQPDGSVLYVCFGSGGALSTRQTAELAAGLEASGQRFLWVVRLPSDKDSSAEQRMNAVMLSSSPEGGGVGVAMRVRDGAVVVPREEVAAVARELMVGEEGAAARRKVQELRAAAEKAAAPDGPARRALAGVVDAWKCARR